MRSMIVPLSMIKVPWPPTINQARIGETRAFPSDRVIGRYRA